MFGEFNSSLFPCLGATAVLFSILGCYFLSQILHQQKPFPYTWISATANHYPGYILFRIGTMSGNVLIILAFFTEHFWIKTRCRQSIFQIDLYKPEIGLILGIMGCLFLLGSSANLDTGRTNINLHIFCATSFFIWTLLACFFNTFIVVVMLINKVKGVNQFIVFIKVVLTLLGIFQIWLEYNVAAELHGSELSNFLEYSLAFTIIGFIYLFVWDVHDFKYSYIQIGTKSKSLQLASNNNQQQPHAFNRTIRLA